MPYRKSIDSGEKYLYLSIGIESYSNFLLLFGPYTFKLLHVKSFKKLVRCHVARETYQNGGRMVPQEKQEQSVPRSLMLQK